ncbi:MAG TPA: T9SS type A sorting domain-containing protein, partial [Chitinophaga sp.]|uniref:T9SS type A sorting domain-containing protein n=1 Tax=Chitinophaga sp. TaxID=1869181 RepID=UPI002F9217D2
TPSAYKAYTATAVGIRSGKDSVVTTTTFAVWNSQTFEGCSGLPLWNANKVYDKPNNIVRYNNTIYRNQWWAGAMDVPGGNTTWAVVGACNSTTPNAAPPANVPVSTNAGQAATVAKIAATPDAKAVNAAMEATVYPNPLVKGGTLSVKVAKYDAAKPVQVTILDVSKKVVAFHKGNAKVLNLSTANLPAGFYILVITNGNNTSTKKIVIQ